MLSNRLAKRNNSKNSAIELQSPERHLSQGPEIWHSCIENDMATKQDVKEQGRELKDEMQKFEYRIVIKLGAIVMAAIAAAVTILKIH